jgi:Ni,Fe-hydrogenase III large subunit/Ni,Fe-hydrogenase III component G
MSGGNGVNGAGTPARPASSSGPSGPSGERTIVEVPSEGLADMYDGFTADGYRLALVAAHHDDPGGADEALRVVYLLVAGPPDSRVELQVRLPADPSQARVPSLAARSFPASRFEREVRDLFGVEPVGHPRPARLVRHQHWPEDWHPLRADAGPPPDFGDESAPYPFTRVEGDGVYEIPVGPIHAGLIEPGHFRFSVVGETILAMSARLWFVHRGIEQLFQGRPATGAIDLAERISGDTAVGHGLAHCLAVEEAAGLQVPAEAQLVRAVLLELERLHNHVTDIGALNNDVGFGVIQAHALRIRERLLRLNADTTGHRLLRGGVVPGGATTRSLPSVATLDAIAADIGDLVDIAMANTTVVDRFTGTAVLPTEYATHLGVLGYVARASGLADDARRQHPFADVYADLAVPVHHAGDVLARFKVRVEEIDASMSLLRRLLDDAEPGRHGDPDAPLLGWSGASGVGIVEGWRGTIVHRVELHHDGTLARAKPVDPSFFNWPALSVALADTIVPDFPLANKSFNLSYAGNDL